MFYVHENCENCKLLIFKFSKVMQQHTKGVMGILLLLLLEIYCCLQQWKKFCKSINNWQSYSKNKSGVRFFRPPCMLLWCACVRACVLSFAYLRGRHAWCLFHKKTLDTPFIVKFTAVYVGSYRPKIDTVSTFCSASLLLVLFSFLGPQ